MREKRRSSKAEQVIRADEAYSVPEFCLRTGLGDYAFREIRRSGLRVIAIGRKRYVRGIDWLELLARQAEQDDHERQSETQHDRN